MEAVTAYAGTVHRTRASGQSARTDAHNHGLQARTRTRKAFRLPKLWLRVHRLHALLRGVGNVANMCYGSISQLGQEVDTLGSTKS